MYRSPVGWLRSTGNVTVQISHRVLELDDNKRRRIEIQKQSYDDDTEILDNNVLDSHNSWSFSVLRKAIFVFLCHLCDHCEHMVWFVFHLFGSGGNRLLRL